VVDDRGAAMMTGGPFNPVLGVQWEFGNGAAVLARDQFDLRQKLPLTRNLAVEVGHCPCRWVTHRLHCVQVPGGFMALH
jgi:hypothetical protein